MSLEAIYWHFRDLGHDHLSAANNALKQYLDCESAQVTRIAMGKYRASIGVDVLIEDETPLGAASELVYYLSRQ